jgi:class 3 adenylate cyclase
MPALPRGEVPCEPALRTAERRALLLMQHRLRTQFQPQCRIDLPSRGLGSSATRWRDVHARPGHGAAHQAAVAAGSAKSFELSLAPGPYRFRTVEAGAEVDGEIGADGVVPILVARGQDIRLERAGGRGELTIRNESNRPLAFVVEDRNWAQDALTGERVIAMPAFRRLCPEQLLRPGDNADIGWIAIMFTDLKGSTEIYDALGDVTAYNLVRDHFAFLLERVQRNHGVVVKTVGDAMMAAFSRPDDAVRAALAIQDDIASFDSAPGGSMNATPIMLKLGIHAGSCIAVTTGDTLDYFGATVNIAARLEHQCRGGEAIVSEAIAKDAEVVAALADRMQLEETAALRGVRARQFDLFGSKVSAGRGCGSFKLRPRILHASVNVAHFSRGLGQAASSSSALTDCRNAPKGWVKSGGRYAFARLLQLP